MDLYNSIEKLLHKENLFFLIGIVLVLSAGLYYLVDPKISLDHILVAVIFFVAGIFIRAFKKAGPENI